MQGRHAVEHADIGAVRERRVQPAQIEEAEGVQAVIDGHHHRVVPRSQALAAVPGGRAAAHGIAAAVEPDHHRPVADAQRRGPDVQHQAVVALGLVGLGVILFGDHRHDRLGADAGELNGVAHPWPGGAGLGRPEAVGSVGGGAIGHAPESHAAFQLLAAQLARAGVDHRTDWGRGTRDDGVVAMLLLQPAQGIGGLGSRGVADQAEASGGGEQTAAIEALVGHGSSRGW